MALWISQKNIQQLIDMPRAIDIVEQAFKALGSGDVSMPQRAGFGIADRGGGAAMPAYVGGEINGLAVKVVTACGNNPKAYKLPVVMATVLLLDAASGQLLAVMDGGWLTALRTGAVSGVATKYLARKEAQTLTLFGAGVQGRQQAQAMCHVRPIKKILLVDPNPKNVALMQDDFRDRADIDITSVSDVQGAVNSADIIVAATTSPRPLFSGGFLKPGTHINGIGSHSPKARELDAVTMERATLIADQRSACLAEAGDILLAIDEGTLDEENPFAAELGELATGVYPGRKDPDEITCFKSVGLAIQDTAVALQVYKSALERGMGQQLE